MVSKLIDITNQDVSEKEKDTERDKVAKQSQDLYDKYSYIFNTSIYIETKTIFRKTGGEKHVSQFNHF